MSSQDFQNYDTTNSTNEFATGRPQHFQHNPSEPLPGAKGGRQPADYDVDTIERTDARFDQAPRFDNSDRVQGAQRADSRYDAPEEERPLGVQPTRSGGVARGGEDDLPEGKAGMMDKVVGKTQKVVGKVAHKPDLHETGELREAGGKAAAQGNARAPHD